MKKLLLAFTLLLSGLSAPTQAMIIEPVTSAFPYGIITLDISSDVTLGIDVRYIQSGHPHSPNLDIYSVNLNYSVINLINHSAGDVSPVTSFTHLYTPGKYLAIATNTSLAPCPISNLFCAQNLDPNYFNLISFNITPSTSVPEPSVIEYLICGLLLLVVLGMAWLVTKAAKGIDPSDSEGV